MLDLKYSEDLRHTDLEQETNSVLKEKGYCIFIEIEDKRLYLLYDGKCIKEYVIATGKSGLPSPIGYWKIIQKADWGEGFGGRWMGLNVPWGMYGIHGTIYSESIGSASSHGCIRMYNKDVAELYSIVPHGTPVVIVNGSFGPFGRGFDDINPGDRGADVRAIQIRLKQLGYFNGYASGIYEDDLKYALHRFQKDKGLEVKNTISREDWLEMGFMEFE
ncbi:MAG TPA: L,D-transpeptidase family protein [Clostridiaceae bacterium]|nr:L,D-transpeptidase family protein [Clostridiaceae bacterium]